MPSYPCYKVNKEAAKGVNNLNFTSYNELSSWSGMCHSRPLETTSSSLIVRGGNQTVKKKSPRTQESCLVLRHETSPMRLPTSHSPSHRQSPALRIETHTAMAGLSSLYHQTPGETAPSCPMSHLGRRKNLTTGTVKFLKNGLTAETNDRDTCQGWSGCI